MNQPKREKYVVVNTAEWSESSEECFSIRHGDEEFGVCPARSSQLSLDRDAGTRDISADSCSSGNWIDWFFFFPLVDLLNSRLGTRNYDQLLLSHYQTSPSLGEIYYKINLCNVDLMRTIVV